MELKRSQKRLKEILGDNDESLTPDIDEVEKVIRDKLFENILKLLKSYQLETPTFKKKSMFKLATSDDISASQENQVLLKRAIAASVDNMVSTMDPPKIEMTKE